MLAKNSKKYDSDSDLETNRSEESDDLDVSTVTNESTKNRAKKLKIRKKIIHDSSSEEDEDWRTQFTRSIRKDEISQKEEAMIFQTNIKRKYPKESLNLKTATVEVKLKDKSNSRFEDLCAICLDNYSNVRGHLGCGHKFCYECIEEWIRTSTKCPCCRKTFSEYVRVTVNDKKVEKKREIIEVEEKVMVFDELDYYICYQCDRGDDEDVLLVCDICEFYCCHVYCDSSLNNMFPNEDWYCKNCKEMLEIKERQKKKNTKEPKKQSKKETKKPEPKIFKPNYVEPFSSDDQEDDLYVSRPTRSMNNLQVDFSSRSKAYEVMNMRPRQTRSNFGERMERVTNNTAINLRNIRRRRML